MSKEPDAGPIMIPPPVLQLMVGASWSTTVTVKLQAALFPDGSVAVALTVVVPVPKNEPDAGDNTTVAEQLSDALAAY